MVVNQRVQREKRRLAETRRAKLRNILAERRSGGSGGSVPSLPTAAQAQANVERQQAAEQQQAAEAVKVTQQAAAQQQKIAAEQQRQREFAIKLERSGGAQTRQFNTVDIRTGDALNITRIKNLGTGESFVTEKNLTKGTTSFKTFEKPKQGGGVVNLTGGLKEEGNLFANGKPGEQPKNEFVNNLTSGFNESSIISPASSSTIFIGSDLQRPPTKFNLDLFKQAGNQFATGSPIQSIKTIFSPITSRKKRPGDLEFSSSIFGSTSDSPLPFGAGGGELTTGFDILRGEALVDPSKLETESFKQRIRTGSPKQPFKLTDIPDTMVDTSNILYKGVGKVASLEIKTALDFTGNEKGIVIPKLYGAQIGEVIRGERTISNFLNFKKRVKPDVVFDLNTKIARLTTEKDFQQSDLFSRTSPKYKLTRDVLIGGADITGRVGTKVALFSIPFVGPALFASEIEQEIRPFDHDPIKFAKAKPIEAALLGGTFLTLGTIGATRATNRFLRAPVIKQQGIDTFISTRGNEIFGRRLSLSTIKGDTFLKRKFKIETLVARPKLQITTQKVGAGQLPKSLQNVKPTVLSLSDESSVKLLDNIITPIKNTGGVSRVIFAGEKKIVIKPINPRLSFDFKGIKVTDRGEKIISKGLSPFTKAGKIERSKVLSELKSLGIDSKTGKALIASRSPRVIETISSIKGKTIQNEAGLKLILSSTETTSSLRVPFNDRFGSILSRGGKSRTVKRDLELTPTGKSLTTGEPIFGGTLKTTDLTKPLGKQIQLSNVQAATKKITTVDDLLGATKVPGIGVVGKPVKFDIFESGQITRDLTPLLRKEKGIQFDKGTVVLRKPTQQNVIDLDEILGLQKKGVRFIKTGGKKSSPQFLKNLYGGQELKATGLDILKPLIKTPRTKPSATTRIETPKIDTLVGISRSIGGKGLTKTQISAGQGNVFDLEPINVPGKLSFSIEEPSSQNNLYSSGLNTNLKTTNANQLRSLLKVGNAIKSDSRVRGSTQVKDLVKLRDNVKLRESQVSKLGLKQKQKELQVSSLTSPGTFRVPPKTPKPPKPPIKKPPIFPFNLKGTDLSSRSGGLFSVSVRRGGKFKSIGSKLSLGQALNLGRSRTESTLAASFRVRRVKGSKGIKGLTTPLGFRKKTDKNEGTIFIEKLGRRLKKRGSEVKEIQLFKSVKKRKSKKGGKKK